MRECQKCGGDVPDRSATCNSCGENQDSGTVGQFRCEGCGKPQYGEQADEPLCDECWNKRYTPPSVDYQSLVYSAMATLDKATGVSVRRGTGCTVDTFLERLRAALARPVMAQKDMESAIDRYGRACEVYNHPEESETGRASDVMEEVSTARAALLAMMSTNVPVV